jgi:oligopeptide/dipeptide ABC transporter ATP-binding protein
MLAGEKRMKDLILQLKNLKVYFPVREGFFRRVVAHVKAVNDVDLELERGTLHALVGESGSGKSTLGRAAIRLLEPTEGKVLINQQEISHPPHSQLYPFRKQMQMIFQDPYSSLNPRHTIERSIGDALLFHQLVKEGKDKKEAVADVLSKVGLSPDVMSRYPHQFSGGQKQRVCIARALCLKPELIVCDEAVSALDVSIQAQILNLLIDLKKSERLSYLFIAHDLHLVQEVSDDVTVMYLGKVMESGKSKEVFNNPKHPYTQALLSSIPHVDPSKRKTKIALKGEIPSPVNPPSGCPFRTRCPYAKPECALPPPLKRPSQTHRYFCIL